MGNIVERNLKSFNAETAAMEFFGEVGPTAARRATLILTDADIKALPVTPLTLVSGIPAGFVGFVLAAYIAINAGAGVYTNVNAAAELTIGDSGVPLTPVALKNGGGLTECTDLFTFGGVARAAIAMRADIDDTTYGSVVQGGTVAGDIVLSIDNAAAGAFTGGNAANTGTITVVYVLVPA